MQISCGSPRRFVRTSPVLLTAVAFGAATLTTKLAQAAGPVDVVGNLPLSTYNTNISSQSYKDWGNEPFVAVNPTNTNQIVISSFAFGFHGGSGDGSLWYSTNGGTSWNIGFPLNSAPSLSSPPSNSTGPNGPDDQVFVYDGGGTLHTAMLTTYASNSNGSDTATNVYHGTIGNPASTGSTTWTNPAVSAGATGTQADQPWMTISGGSVFAGYDVYGGTGVSERVNLSTNGGSTFNTDMLVGKTFNSTVNPGLRLASDSHGNAYAIWGVGTGSSGNLQAVTYHLNRFTAGGSSFDYTNNPTSDNAGGLVIDSGVSSQVGATMAGSFGGKNQLFGNITAVATDAAGSHVYAVYGKRDGTGTDRIWLAEFHSDNTGNLTERPTPVALSVAGERSALPSVAVAANGAIGVMYDTSTSTDSYQVHFAESTDGGLTFSDQTLYTFSTSGFNLNTSGFPISDRLLGDYQYLLADGNTFYGTFAGTGDVNSGGINTTDKIDPFFFSQAAVPEPLSAAMLLPAALWLLCRRRDAVVH